MTEAQSTIKEAVDTLQDVDATAADAAEEYRETPVVRAISLLSEMGDQPQLRSLSAAAILGGLVAGDARLTRAGIRMLAAHELATFVKNVVKRRIDRTRPRSREEAEDAHKIRPGDDQSKEETSFPSGHSAGAASVARAFAREFPEYPAPAYAAGGAVALAQIPRCAHYPTDVGAGIAIGVAAEAAVDAGWRLLAAAAARD